MIVFPSTAKLTGSIMIPSADVNPTRPTPPGSSRSKHSAGLSVRMVRSPAAALGAWDSRSGETLNAPRLYAGPFPVVMDGHLRHSRAVASQPCRAARRTLRPDVPPGWAVRHQPVFL